ncbi:hypothetical protein NC652_003408 [Populus alba x Populus x berolinensis]|nr:hypothetical protein NC652_003408 [Populus alba x Populus x berolinensis]
MIFTSVSLRAYTRVSSGFAPLSHISPSFGSRQEPSQAVNFPKWERFNGIYAEFYSMHVFIKLFVGGLAWSTDDQSLKDVFFGFGEVTYAKVITDRDTGRSHGFGFVSYESTESASEALSAMDGQELGGRNIRMSYATDKRQPQPYNSNDGGNPYY